jgi:hypothetical protein
MTQIFCSDQLPSLYIKDGLPVGPDGRIHTQFRHDPSTLRLSAAEPNLQNIPRGSTDLQKLVRGFFVAPAGFEFWKVDFSGIEGILTGFFANAPRVMRIFRLDGHSFVTAHILHLIDKVIPFTDLPQESWSDEDLRAYLKGIKKTYGARRETTKKITHGANYKETARMAQVILLNELGKLYPVKDIAKVIDAYYELLPEIPRWHLSLEQLVGGVETALWKVDPPQLWGAEARHTTIRTPFNVVHRYYDAVKWKRTPLGWDWESGDDAKRLASLLPQSTARFCLTRAAQRIWNDPDKQDVAKTFRLFIHDEIFGSAPTALVERCMQVVSEEMSKPIPELALPAGELLALGTEAKRGPNWATMQ